MPANLIQQVQQAETSAAAAARVTYIELLRRSSDPHEGDADALRTVMTLLGKTAASAEADLAVLREAEALQAKFGGLLAAKVARVAADKVINAADRAFGEVRTAHDRLRRERCLASTVLSIKEQRCREAGRALKALQERHRSLFGLPPAPPAPPEDRTGEPGRPGIGAPVVVRPDSGTASDPPLPIEQGVFIRAPAVQK